MELLKKQLVEATMCSAVFPLVYSFLGRKKGHKVIATKGHDLIEKLEAAFDDFCGTKVDQVDEESKKTREHFKRAREGDDDNDEVINDAKKRKERKQVHFDTHVVDKDEAEMKMIEDIKLKYESHSQSSLLKVLQEVEEGCKVLRLCHFNSFLGAKEVYQPKSKVALTIMKMIYEKRKQCLKKKRETGVEAYERHIWEKNSFFREITHNSAKERSCKMKNN